MIHTIFVSPETDPADLKKQMRKRLMTGGAVVRLSSDLPSSELEIIYERFSPMAVRHSVAAEVLLQLALHSALSAELREKLRRLEIPEVSRMLETAR